MFARLGRLVVRHPWKVIAIWLLAAVVTGVFAPKLASTSDQSQFLPTHYESIQAADLQQQAFPKAAQPEALIVFERSDGQKLTEADSAKIDAIAQDLTGKKLEGINGVMAVPLTANSNRLIQIAPVQMNKVTNPQDKAQLEPVTRLRDALQPELKGTDLKAGVTGQAAQFLDQQASGNKALLIIGVATVVLILALLLIIFRSPIIALLPIITIAIVSVVANGLIATVSKAFDLKIDASVTQLLTIVLYGIGTDYILFLMFRYRERLRLGEDPKKAIVNAIARVGEAIASSAAVVVIAFLALTLSTLGMFRAMGPALAIAVALTLLAGLTLIPAVVSLLGTKVFWPSKAWQKEPTGTRFASLGSALGRRPALFAIVSGGALAVLAVAALGFHPNFDLQSGSTSNASESTVYQKEMLKGVPAGATAPSDVYLKSTNGAPLTATALADYGAKLSQVSGVGGVAAPVLSEDKAVADFQVTLSDTPESGAAIKTVRGPLRDVAHAAAPAGTTAVVGGMTSIFVDFQAAMNHDYAIVFPVAGILIMIVLALLLRSVVAPWYLMASVGLGFAATLGAAVLVFQHLQHQPGLIFHLPLIMYLFVVALGTDYNILMIARLREEAQEGRSPREAAAQSLKHAGPTVAAAGLILAGSFASMILAGNSVVAQMGFAISLGIAIAAFVMAMFLTPAITALIGHAAWWPGHGDEVRPHPDDLDRRDDLVRV